MGTWVLITCLSPRDFKFITARVDGNRPWALGGLNLAKRAQVWGKDSRESFKVGQLYTAVVFSEELPMTVKSLDGTYSGNYDGEVKL